MRRLFKWSFRILGVVIVLGAIGLGLLYLILLKGVPEDHGSVQIAGLAEPVNIVRDDHGIPHIKAQSYTDALMALGFVHAQERLWQMEVLRMAGQGRLSELFGEATEKTDVFLQTLDIGGHAERSYGRLDEVSKQRLEAYVAGINAWIASDKGGFAPSLPVEYLILGLQPEPWKPWHPAAILKTMDLTLAKNLGHEIQRLALAARGFGPEEIEEMMPYGPRDNAPKLPDLRTVYGFGPKGKATAFLGRDNGFEARPIEALAIQTGLTASNNWVVAGSKTESGKPLMGNDPHLGLTAPSVFYLAHLRFENEGEAINLIGGTLPGTPLVLVGRNDKVAWGLTTTGLDSQDLYIEAINPQNVQQYRVADGWRDFVVEPFTIKFSNGREKQFVRKRTRHGPVLPEDYRDLKRILPDNHVAALQWTALTDDDITIGAILNMVTSTNVMGFMEHHRNTLTPMQSISIADVDGNIGILAPGRIPVRSEDNLIRGRAPVPGWLPSNDWQGFVPFAEVPRIYNPPAGAATTANANWLPKGYGHHITFDWAEHFRQARAEQLILGRNGKHSMASMQEAISDSYSPAMVRFRDLGLELMPDGLGPGEGIVEGLKAWDGNMEAQKPEPLIMISWFRNLNEAMFSDDLGKDFERFERGRITRIINILDAQRSRDWCDDQKSDRQESCGDILLSSLRSAVKELKGLQGDDWAKWRWGKAHIGLGEHRPFAQVGPLATLFNVTIESGGGPYTLRRGQTDFSKKQPYANRHASAYRAIYDMANPDQSQFIQSTGQSGNFLSDRYREYSHLWANMGFVPMDTKAGDRLAENPARVWVLEPKN